MRVFLICAALGFSTLLAGCKVETEQEELARITSGLPEGCTIFDLGDYRSIDQLVVVVCDGRATVTTQGYMHKQNGKITETDRHVSVQIGEEVQ